MRKNSTYWSFTDRITAGQRAAVCAFILILLSCTVCFADRKEVSGYTEYDYGINADASAYDETSVFINVQRVGGIDIPAMVHNRMVYLSIADVFGFLKIKHTASPDRDSITGFFIDPGATFVIDKINNRILYKGKIQELKAGDLIRTETNLYLQINYFSQIFGLDCTFDFRNLSVKINTALELPAVREIRQTQIRNNINRLKGEAKADTSIGRTYPLFHLGMADWSIISMQEINGKSDTRLSMAVGAVLAGGELNTTFNYFSNAPFNNKQQFYQWRYANNDHSALRQVMLGKIAPQATASLFAPVMGIQVTNAPTTFRRSFDTYKLSDVTKPGLIVELYVNNVLIDYTKADASGFFSFDVPMVYGSSTIKLRFYGPWGEESTKEEYISIPYQFLPTRELQYVLSAGIVEDGRGSRYAKANLNYGLNNRITIGGGMEYLSSITTGKYMPFVNAALRLAPGLNLSGEYMHGVRLKSVLNYRLPSNIQLELGYTKYARQQTAIIFNYLEERKVVLFVPFYSNHLSLMSRLTLNQIVLPDRLKYTTGEWLVSGSVAGINASIGTNMVSVKQSDPVKFDPYFYSNISLAFRLPKGFMLTPSAQYGYKEKEFISIKCILDKRVFKKVFLNINYEQNFKSSITNLGIGLRYDFSFARVGMSARQCNKVVQLVQSARGSLIYDRSTDYLSATNRNNVGRSGVTLLPYLDINGNERLDVGEPKVKGLEAEIRTGRLVYDEHDTLIRIFDLEPYTNHPIYLTKNGFENIGWQIRNKVVSIIADPNQLKLIEIPVAVLNEAYGSVQLEDPSGKKAQEGIKICLYRDDDSLVAFTLTEQDGTFNFQGLKAGFYTARLDPAQLKKLNMTATPFFMQVNIPESYDGMQIEHLSFNLRPTEAPHKEIEQLTK
jgi:hypothetical protein